MATFGCRSDPAIPILERELRLQEDEIYRLRGALEDLQDSAACQSRPARGSAIGTDGEREINVPRRSTTSDAPSGAQPPLIQMPSQPGTTVPDSLKVPSVPEHLQGPSKPLGSGDRRSSGFAPASPRADADSPALEQDGMGFRPARITMASLAASAVPFIPSGDSRRVASIALDRAMTGGIGAADAAGDQGLLVVVEPRDRAGRSVDAPAEINVVVLDPALTGDAARVARWDFLAAETAALFRRTGSSQAIHLTMTWPGEPPKHNKLHLYVRYVTADGRKLNLDQSIEVALADDKTTRWAPRDVGGRVEQAAAVDSAPTWRTNEIPAVAPAMPPPQVVAPPTEQKPHRPAWSPER